MIATLCLSAQSRRPIIVLLATMLALLTATTLAILFALILAAALPVDLLVYISGGLFLALGFATLLKTYEDEEIYQESRNFIGMYFLVLASELGDKSQIAILALATSSVYPILILFGAFLGFLAVNAIGAFIGDRISEALPMDLIRKATGALFILFGILIFLNVI